MARTKKIAKDKDETKAKPADEGVGSFEDKDFLVKYILDCKKEADDATDTIRAQWRELWDLYQNKQDYSKKASWQSQTCIPKLFMAIERASLMIERATLQVAKLFHIELDDEFVLPLKSMIRRAKKDVSKAKISAHKVYVHTGKVLNLLENAQEKVPGAEQVILKQQEMIQQADDAVTSAKEKLRELEDQLNEYEEEAQEDDKRFKAHLKKTNFVPAFGEMIKPACLLGLGIIKRLWKSKRLNYETKDNQNIYIAPDYQPFQEEPPRYIIEEKEMLLCDLIEMARSANNSLAESEGKGKVFDMTEIDNITDDTTDLEKKAQQNEQKGLDEHKSVSIRVKVLEFWGTVVSKDGKEKNANRLMMLANEKYLIRNQENPFDDPIKRPPYDECVPMPYPHRGLSGSSMVQAEIKLQYTLNNLLNMAIDNLNFTTNTMFEYDPLNLKEPERMTRIFPGKLIQTKAGMKGPVISQVITKGITNDFFKIFEMVSKELQEGTAVNEFLTSMPSKSAKTLGEIEIKTAESHGYFDVIARKIEVNSIRKILRNSYAMLCQFTTEFKNLERYQFNVGGLSLLLLQKQQVEYLIQALSMALKYPQLMQTTDIKDLWERLLSIWNLDDAHREEDTSQIMQQMPQQPQQPQPQRPQPAAQPRPPGPQLPA